MNLHFESTVELELFLIECAFAARLDGFTDCFIRFLFVCLIACWLSFPEEQDDSNSTVQSIQVQYNISTE